VRFWDSSAIIPLLVRQTASPRTDQWFAEDSEVVIWTLTPVEITSAVWRLVRDSALGEPDAQAAELRARQLSDASHVIADVDLVKSVAQRTLRVHPLRAADAMQLAAALVWAGGRPQGLILHTLDERLAASARREGFEVP
jgi:predicted nucleic acid-binding protein